MNSAKQELRRAHLARLATVSAATATAAGAAIARRLLDSPQFAAARAVAAFVAMPTEPNLTPLLEAVLVRGLVLLLPVWDPPRRAYLLRQIADLADLRPGHYGIPEPPPTAPALDPNGFHDSLLWLVPGVAFDAEGRRLGRGGGYYDRLLHDTQSTSIGIAYDWQIVPAVPTDPHDVRVDAVATERRLLPAAVATPIP